MVYYKDNKEYFAQSNNYDEFYCKVLQVVSENWKRTGNSILGYSDSKVSRLFSGKQKDFEMLIEMAEFMKMTFSFKMY